MTVRWPPGAPFTQPERVAGAALTAAGRGARGQGAQRAGRWAQTPPSRASPGGGRPQGPGAGHGSERVGPEPDGPGPRRVEVSPSQLGSWPRTGRAACTTRGKCPRSWLRTLRRGSRVQSCSRDAPPRALRATGLTATLRSLRAHAASLARRRPHAGLPRTESLPSVRTVHRAPAPSGPAVPIARA